MANDSLFWFDLCKILIGPALGAGIAYYAIERHDKRERDKRLRDEIGKCYADLTVADLNLLHAALDLDQEILADDADLQAAHYKFRTSRAKWLATSHAIFARLRIAHQSVLSQAVDRHAQAIRTYTRSMLHAAMKMEFFPNMERSLGKDNFDGFNVSLKEIEIAFTEVTGKFDVPAEPLRARILKPWRWLVNWLRENEFIPPAR